VEKNEKTGHTLIKAALTAAYLYGTWLLSALSSFLFRKLRDQIAVFYCKKTLTKTLGNFSWGAGQLFQGGNRDETEVITINDNRHAGGVWVCAA
jgi:hypothetical protein